MRKMMLALLCLAILSAYCCMATEPIATEGGAGQPAAEKPAGASASGVVPAATIVQVFKLDRESPKELRPTPGRGTLGRSMAVVGDYLYEGGCGEGRINWFKRNLKTGELVYAGSLTNTTLKNWYQMRATGNRLYVLGQGGWGAPDSSEGLVVYDVNPQTGAIEEKAALKGHEVAGECLEIDAEGHSIYTFCGNDGRLRWYRIEADGKPTLAGELTQKNGDFRFGTGLTLSPDGKNLYVVTSGHPLQWSREFCIWVFSRKPTGEVSFSKKVPLASVLPKDLPKEFGSYWISLAAISPDGRWVYVAMNSREQAPIFAIYQRDLETGDLTLKESCPTCVPCLRLASMSALKLVFLPDGSGGFTANGGPWGVLESFRLDKETGRLCDITDDVDVQIKCISCSELVLDAKNGWMYGPLWAAKLGKTEAKGDRPDIETTVAASVATRKWGPEADWTGWRGANYDLKSPIKGITRDWSRGLPKVWEVKGLSPQSSSWSSLAVQEDRLVMMGRHGQIDEIFCFDADKGGRPLWIAEYAAEGGDYGYGCGPQGTPRIDGDKVYCASRYGQFLCLNLADGRILWRKGVAGVGHGYSACPLIWNDLVMAVGGDNKPLTAYKKDTGEKVWSFGDRTGEDAFASPVRATIGGKDQIVFHYGKHAWGIDPATGATHWEASIAGAGVGTPIVAGDIVYTPAYPDVFRVLADGKVERLWKKDGEKTRSHFAGWTDSLEIGGCVYTFLNRTGFGGTAGDLTCFDIKTGDVKWVQKDTACGHVVGVDGLVMGLTYTGNLFLFDPQPDGFKKITEWKQAVKRTQWWFMGGQQPYGDHDAPCWTTPVVARGKVYLRYSDSMICYNLMAE